METSSAERPDHPTGPDLNRARQESRRVERREADRRSEESELNDRRAAAKSDPNRGENIDTYA